VIFDRQHGIPRALDHRTSTAAYDQAIINGKPIPTEPVAGPARRTQMLPLDLWIVDFAE
jgi:hypothetical protein